MYAGPVVRIIFCVCICVYVRESRRVTSVCEWTWRAEHSVTSFLENRIYKRI